MSRNLTQALADWLQAGYTQMGQIALRPHGPGFALCHFEDLGREDLRVSTNPVDSRALGTYNDAGEFRPMRTAPDLRHGWLLTLPDLDAVRTALDGFYPAMLGSLLSYQLGALRAVPLRETLGRQSGMYAVTKKLTDAQAEELVACACRSSDGCLKTILWELTPGRPLASLECGKTDPTAPQLATPEKTLPMYCAEACNLLVAKARETVKSARAPE